MWPATNQETHYQTWGFSPHISFPIPALPCKNTLLPWLLTAQTNSAWLWTLYKWNCTGCTFQCLLLLLNIMCVRFMGLSRVAIDQALLRLSRVLSLTKDKPRFVGLWNLCFLFQTTLAGLKTNLSNQRIRSFCSFTHSLAPWQLVPAHSRILGRALCGQALANECSEHQSGPVLRVFCSRMR